VVDMRQPDAQDSCHRARDDHASDPPRGAPDHQREKHGDRMKLERVTKHEGLEHVAGKRMSAERQQEGESDPHSLGEGEKEGSMMTIGMGNATASTVPTFGMKLSQNASNPNTSHKSTCNAESDMAVKTPTSNDISTLPRM